LLTLYNPFVKSLTYKSELEDVVGSNVL